MSNTLLLTSNVILWILVLFLLVVVLLIYKQVGDLILSRGATPQRDDQGPDIGEVAPSFAGFDVASGRAIEREPRKELLVFTFPGCAGCEQIAETLPVLAKHRPETSVTFLGVYSERDVEQAGGRVGAVGDVILPEVMRTAERRGNVAVVIAPVGGAPTAHNRYGIAATPFALAVDEGGRVAAKMMLRSPEDLPRLLSAWSNEGEDEMQAEVVEVGRGRAPTDGF